MKTLKFIKMAGAGNDFILMDRPNRINVQTLAQRICNRSNGIGADGLILLCSSKKADFKMRIINADGSEAEMCGNGARCFAAYIVQQKRSRKKVFTIETLAGILQGEVKGEVANVRLTDPIDYQPNKNIRLDGKMITVHYIDTGVPHIITYVDDLAGVDLSLLGPKLRHHEAFEPRGVNVNFVSFEGKTLVASRTYERGVEAETKACGTGSVAAAIVSYMKLHPFIENKKCAKMRVRTKSGEILQVSFDISHHSFSNVYLKGSAKLIAKGEYYV